MPLVAILRTALIAAAFGAANISFAQNLAPRIDGATEATVGDLVELRAASDAGTVAWGVVQPVSHRTYDGGRVLVFAASRPGRVECIAFAAVATADGKILVTSMRHVVNVVGPPTPPTPPGPPTPPTPPGPVDPNPPADRWGLIRIARETAPRDEMRAKVRANYAQAATQLASGAFPTLDAARARLREWNRAAVGNAAVESNAWHRFAWQTATRMDEAQRSGTLSTAADVARAWSDIAKGLEE